MCKNYGGFISWNYYICTAYKTENNLDERDIYDRDVLTKGTCSLYMPIETELFQDIDGGKNDNLHADDALDRGIEKNDQSIPDKE